MKKLNAILLTLAVLLSSAFYLQAQSTIAGTVYDDAGEALIGANVLIEGTAEGTVTDFDGSFSFTTTSEFPLNLAISFTGFNTQVMSLSEASQDLSITLSEGVLIGDDVVISASRKREKVQEAPASISVISARKLEGTAQATDPVRNLVNVPGVQIQQQSAARINISMRGSAGLFGTSAFPILDYRSLIGPGIGTFQSDNSGLSTIDLQRIEVVRGPGSALYGPGVTAGVVHFISKNPINFPGTSIEVFGGELNTFGASVRHAGHNKERTFGYKINAHYKRGDEFTLDPQNASDAIQIAKFAPVNPFTGERGIYKPNVVDGVVDGTSAGTLVLPLSELDEDGDGNPMQDNWYNASVNATLEFRPQDDLSVTVSGGMNQASAVFYNEQGEGLSQATEYWTQARMQKGGLFAQLFYVDNDGGSDDKPTFLYQTGNVSNIARTQLEGQLQYNFGAPSILNSDWTAGVDYRSSSQDTENLVYGRSEQDDDYSIIGGYVQGKFELTEKLDLVLAGRYDQFNFIDDGAFAPRAAIVFKASPKHTFRGSFNRANSTVSNLQLNIDFPLATVIPGSFDVWLYNNKVAQTFGDNPMISWFSGLIPSVPVGAPGLPLGVPLNFVNAQVIDGLTAFLSADPNTAGLAPVVASILGNLDPTTLGFTGQLSDGFNIFDGSPLGLVDAPQTLISTEDTWEVGYKGLFGDKLGVTLDVYNVDLNNFSQFTAISPAFILSGYDALPGDLGNAVQNAAQGQIEGALLAAGFDAATAAGTAAQLGAAINGAYAGAGASLLSTPNPAFGGASLGQVLAALPFHGTVSTDQVPDNGITHIAAGYRTFDNINYWGADLGLSYFIDNDFSLFANYSWVSDNEFVTNVVGAEGVAPLPYNLNVPKNKYRLGFNYAPEMGIRANLSFQHDDSFNANAGQFSGPTDEKNLVDIGVGYKFDNGLSIDLTAQNLFDSKYRAYPNMPQIGRRALAKLTYSFGTEVE